MRLSPAGIAFLLSASIHGARHEATRAIEAMRISRREKTSVPRAARGPKTRPEKLFTFVPLLRVRPNSLQNFVLSLIG